MASTATRPRYFWWAAAAIVLAGFGLRVWQLGDASLWYDEVLTEMRAQASMDRFFTLILDSGNQTPLYFATLRAIPTENEFWLRLPSAVFGAVGIGLLIVVALRLYGDHYLALLGGALLASNPYHVWLSRTARPYALLLVMTLLASYFFLLLRGDRSRGNWIGFILTSMAAYLTHYFALALPLAQYVLFAFILRGNRGFFRRWLRAQFIAAIPLVIWVFALMRQETVAFGIGWIPRPGPADIALTGWNMLVGYDGSLSWYLLPGLVAGGVGLFAGMYAAARERATERANFYWFWLVLAPLALAFVVSLFRPLYVDRYFTIFLPAVVLLTVQGWLRLPVRRRWRGAAVGGLAALVVLAGVISGLATIERGDDVKEDWRAAAAYVEDHQQPGDALLLETPITLVVFLRYFDGEAMPRAWLLDAPPPDEQYGASVDRIWAVYRNPNEDGHKQGVLPDFDPFKPSESPLSDWLIARREAVVMQQAFNGVTVVLVAGGGG